MNKRTKRPWIIAVFGAILSLQAMILPIFVLLFGFMSASTSITFNGEEVLLGDVRFEVVGSLLVWLAIAALVGPGFWRGNSRARDAAMAVFVIAIATKLFMMQIYKELPLDLAFTALVAWYLYRKPNVVAFFRCA